MPQINISTAIDAEFLAKQAGLDKAWGAVNVSQSVQSFAFLAKDMDVVEAALTAYPAAYLEHKKSLKLEEIANKRRVEELKGPSGLVLDDKTNLRLGIKVVDLMRHPDKTGVRWEVSRGNFTILPREVILGLADLSIQHVEDCFENVYNLTEAVKAIQLDEELEDQVEALTNALDELDSIDVNSGWPA